MFMIFWILLGGCVLSILCFIDYKDSVLVSKFQVAVERDFDPETLRQLIYSLERL